MDSINWMAELHQHNRLNGEFFRPPLAVRLRSNGNGVMESF